MARGRRLLSVATMMVTLLVADSENRERSKDSRELSLARSLISSHVAVWDPNHAYTTFLSCPDDRCAFTLAATGDGGRTWARRPLPLDTLDAVAPERRRSTEFRLAVLGPRILRLWWPASQPGPAWWSTDAGATWQPAPAALPVVPSVPQGWVLLDRLARNTRFGAEKAELTVGDPATGAAALVFVPSWSTYVQQAGPLDRGMWLSATGHYSGSLYVSDDRGASTRKVTPWPDSPDLSPVAAVAPDGTVYAAANRTRQGEPLLARSTDRGRTWESLAAKGLEPGRELFLVATPPDGTLAVVSEYLYDRRFHVSRDGGRTFTQLPVGGFPRRAYGFAPLPGGGYASQNGSEEFDSDALVVSDDLRTWRTLRPPTR